MTVSCWSIWFEVYQFYWSSQITNPFPPSVFSINSLFCLIAFYSYRLYSLSFLYFEFSLVFLKIFLRRKHRLYIWSSSSFVMRALSVNDFAVSPRKPEIQVGGHPGGIIGGVPSCLLRALPVGPSQHVSLWTKLGTPSCLHSLQAARGRAVSCAVKSEVLTRFSKRLALAICLYKD